MAQVVTYRKSGLSLNHVIGCPLDCGSCVRHFWGNFEVKTPQLLVPTQQAIGMLTGHLFGDQAPAPASVPETVDKDDSGRLTTPSGGTGRRRREPGLRLPYGTGEGASRYWPVPFGGPSGRESPGG
jgi:hypothetical protein